MRLRDRTRRDTKKTVLLPLNKTRRLREAQRDNDPPPRTISNLTYHRRTCRKRARPTARRIRQALYRLAEGHYPHQEDIRQMCRGTTFSGPALGCSIHWPDRRRLHYCRPLGCRLCLVGLIWSSVTSRASSTRCASNAPNAAARAATASASSSRNTAAGQT